MLPALLTTFLWSVSVVCATRSTRYLGGPIANLTRLCLATVLLAIWAHSFGKGVSGAGLGYFVLSGFIGFGLGDLALYEALPRIGSRLTLLLMQCLAAPIGAVIEWLWMGTTLSSRQILAGAVILTGVVIALMRRETVVRDPRHRSPGIIFGILAAFGQGGGAVMSRKAFFVSQMAGVTIDGGTAAYQRIIGGIGVAAVYFVLLRLHNGPADTKVSEWRSSLPWVIGNTLGGPVVGVACYQWALSTAPSGVVLPIVATLPLAVIPFAYHVEDDRPGWHSLLGGIIAVIGVVLLLRAG